MSLNIDTAAYAASHKREPRGDGLWIFHGSDRAGRRYTFETGGTYTEARQRVRVWARERRLVALAVAP